MTKFDWLCVAYIAVKIALMSTILYRIWMIAKLIPHFENHVASQRILNEQTEAHQWTTDREAE